MWSWRVSNLAIQSSGRRSSSLVEIPQEHKTDPWFYWISTFLNVVGLYVRLISELTSLIPLSSTLCNVFTHENDIVGDIVCWGNNILVIEVRQMVSNIWVFEDQTKAYEIDICYFSAKHAAVRVIAKINMLSCLPADRHVAPLGSISWFRANQSLFFLLYAACFSGEATNTNFIVLDVTRSWCEPTTYSLEASTLTLTPPMRLPNKCKFVLSGWAFVA